MEAQEAVASVGKRACAAGDEPRSDGLGDQPVVAQPCKKKKRAEPAVAAAAKATRGLGCCGEESCGEGSCGEGSCGEGATKEGPRGQEAGCEGG